MYQTNLVIGGALTISFGSFSGFALRHRHKEDPPLLVGKCKLLTLKLLVIILFGIPNLAIYILF